jgi:hypothetical protein
MWTNLINGKQYIGSAVNLTRRFREYFNINYLLRYTNMYICNALFKHGYSNFSLTILEYCKSEKCLEREGYYQTKINTEYNICKKPGAPMSGRTHSDETKIKMSDSQKKNDHSGRFKPGQKKLEGAGRPSQAVEVTDTTNNTTTSYNSIREAARVLNLPSHKTIDNYIKNNQIKAYKGKYIFKKL